MPEADPDHMSDPTAVFLTTSQFARRLGVSEATVKRRCDRGELAYLVISERGDRRIPATELDRLMAAAHENRHSQHR